MSKFELAALREDILRDPADFIARCDERYDRLVRETAGQIADHLKNSPIVLLAGPSGSGKTTTASRIRKSLEESGIRAHMVSLDDYYLDADNRAYPKLEDGQPDLESPLGLDGELLNRQLALLAGGEQIEIPHFDFKIHRRAPDKARPLRLGRDEIVIFEGLHALNPMFTGRNPEALRLYVSTSTDYYDGQTLMLPHGISRLLRRCIRDLFHRNASAAETLSLWANVCRGERLYIKPYSAQANVSIDTTFGYELPVLAKIAEPQFFSLPDDTPQMALVLAIQRTADKLPPIDLDLVPADSLLREEFLQ